MSTNKSVWNDQVSIIEIKTHKCSFGHPGETIVVHRSFCKNSYNYNMSSIFYKTLLP